MGMVGVGAGLVTGGWVLVGVEVGEELELEPPPLPPPEEVGVGVTGAGIGVTTLG
jgi:hypothetical protein